VSTVWTQRPVLVTGATGFLGGWLTQRLLEEGARVICLVRDWRPDCDLTRSGRLDQCITVRGDVRDQALLERTLSEYEVATVFHVAAQALVPIANQNPGATFEANIAGTWTLLEACRRTHAPVVVVASSDKAYGPQPSLPYTETMPLQGRHPYDVSKSCADLIAQSYATTYGLPVAITRCGNLYGGGDLNWSRLIPGTIRAALNGQRPIIRSDGQLVRDYLHVSDAVTGYLQLAEALATIPELRGEAFNFSTETPVTVLDVVNAILQQLESNLTPDLLNPATNEIREQHLSAAKARAALDWHAEISLAQGLTSTIAWYRDWLSSLPALTSP